MRGNNATLLWSKGIKVEVEVVWTHSRRRKTPTHMYLYLRGSRAAIQLQGFLGTSCPAQAFAPFSKHKGKKSLMYKHSSSSIRQPHTSGSTWKSYLHSFIYAHPCREKNESAYPVISTGGHHPVDLVCSWPSTPGHWGWALSTNTTS